MFKIGDFSRLTRVSMKTLHHYDDIGLFKPAHVDRFTGYRYYTFEQLPCLNRILVLKGLGFSLDEIRQMLDGEPTPAEMRGMLRLRRAQLECQVTEGLEKLRQVEIRLRQIEQEGNMSTIDVLVKPLDALTIVGARELVASLGLMRERCMALDHQCRDLMQSAGLKSDGICFAIYHAAEETGVDVEMAYVVEPPPGVPAPPAGSAARVHVLPATWVAYAVYDGSYDDFGAIVRVNHVLRQWIDYNGWRSTGAPRELYLRPPDRVQSAHGVMEIQYPIVKGEGQ